MGAFNQLAQGMLAGQQLHMQMQRAADEHQQLQQELAEQATRASIQDVMNQNYLDTISRPVIAGTVQDQMNLPDTTVPGNPGRTSGVDQSGMPNNLQQPPAGQPDVTTEDLQNLPTRGTTVPGQSYSFARKPDASRLHTYTDSQGNKQQRELMTPQEQLQRKIALDASGAFAQAQLNAQVAYLGRRAALGLPGNAVPVSDAVTSALGLPRGYQATLAEMPEIASRYDAMRKASRVTNAPGSVTTQLPFGMQGADEGAAPGADTGTGGGSAPGAQPLGTENPFATPGSLPAGQTPTAQPPTAAAQPGASQPGTQPGGAQVIATGGPRLPEGEFERDFLPAYAGKLGKTVDKLTPDEKIAAFGQFKEANADPQMRAAMLAQKNLAQILAQAQIGQIPTKEQAAGIADDMLNHRLAPAQLAEIRGRGNGALGLMVAAAARAKDPKFSWERADSEYRALEATEKGFTSGRQADLVRANNNALEHLGLLEQAGRALKSNDLQMLNQIATYLGEKTGSAAPTVYDTIAKKVGDETTKAFIPGGGGQGERAAGADDFSRKLSDEQREGNIAAAIHLMDSQQRNLQDQYNRGTYGQGAQKLYTDQALAVRQRLLGAPATALPKGGGKAADAGIIKQFLDANGGDKDKARAALKANNWTIPAK